MDAAKQRLKDQFDKEASNYDTSKASQFAVQSYPYVLNTIMPVDFNNILDIGCGTGTFLRKVLDGKPQVKAYGLDLSDKMIEAAKGKLPKRVELVWGEAEALPYDNKRFEMVVMVDTLRFCINHEQAVKEAYRVLRPGGKLVICGKMATGIKKLFGERKTLNEAEVRNALINAGFDVVNFMKNIPNGYIATGDKR